MNHRTQASTCPDQTPVMFDVQIRQGCYDPNAPREKYLKVTIAVPDLPPVEILLPADVTHSLFTEGGVPWPELAQHAIRLRNACVGTERADIAALTGWLADQGNLEAFYQAWAQRRLSQLQKRAHKTACIIADHRKRWSLDVVPAELARVVELAQAPDFERHEPCPVACDRGDHPLTAPALSPDEFSREHRFVVAKINTLEVTVTVFEMINNGHRTVDPATITLYRDGVTVELADIAPADAVDLGHAMARAGQLAKTVRA